jgi:hypothetical protein
VGKAERVVFGHRCSNDFTFSNASTPLVLSDERASWLSVSIARRKALLTALTAFV